MKTLKICQTVLLILAGMPLAAAGQSANGEGSEFNNGEEGAEIFAAALGGIQNFEVVDNQTLIIEGRSDNMYRVELFGRCPGLRFEESLIFLTGPGGNLDRFSSILVDGQRCNFRSIARIEEEERVRDLND